MKIAKNSYDELRHLYEDLRQFMCDTTHNLFEFRMIVFEYYCVDKRTENISYFDSNKQIITKTILRDKQFHNLSKDEILSFFEISKDFAMIESDAENSQPERVKQAFYVIFDFSEVINPILMHFLNAYQQKILQRFNKRTTVSANELLDSKEEIFDEIIKNIINFDVISALAGSQYEKRESLGSIIYVSQREEAHYKVVFSKNVGFNAGNLRLIRKLLEMSDNKLSLIVHDNNIIGLGTAEGNVKKIQFGGRQKWTLFINNEDILRFSRGDLFFDHGYDAMYELPNGFIQKRYEKKFNDLINMLMKQRHGALLIISDQAPQEVARLSGLERGYAIEPIDLTDNMSLIKNIASVDGAVFIDRQLKCYGTGIILDGIAKRPGSNARGSRFNSSVCYLDSKTEAPYVAIVFSEDETVDVLHNYLNIEQFK